MYKSTTESVNVESKFRNKNLTSLNENIDFSIMKEIQKPGRKLVLLIGKTVQVQNESTKKIEIWEQVGEN